MSVGENEIPCFEIIRDQNTETTDNEKMDPLGQVTVKKIQMEKFEYPATLRLKLSFSGYAHWLRGYRSKKPIWPTYREEGVFLKPASCFSGCCLK